MAISKKKLWLRRTNWYCCLARNTCIDSDVFWRLWSPTEYEKHKRTWRIEK